MKAYITGRCDLYMSVQYTEYSYLHEWKLRWLLLDKYLFSNQFFKDVKRRLEWCERERG